MESVQIQPPSFTFRALNKQWKKLDCFPIPGNSVICIDQLGHSSIVNVPLRYGATMPRLHNPKRMPIFFFVHKPDVDKKHDWNLYGTSVFIMERIPELEVGCCTEKYSDQFENHTWIEVGKWTLPYRGKVEYVPELKLWLGFSAKNRHLAAADLSGISTMNSQPQLMDLGERI
ncbi:hypothetical protein PR202_ga20938 [Eleusine coracana subsp. coracana]|uniref:Uncharacterized protein n=1 Tax=Eleusine coracana subsp. coracana TaxID=191504 RepID=A0AAV5CZ26_ELECO|nr:hypothetical protein PR202_ga20938 [Eleusine coracana subsp. coracana]